jgi:hypothetical protein
MRPLRFIGSGLLGLVLCVSLAHAETPPTQRAESGRSPRPARLLPQQADLLIEVPQPRRLVETLTTLDALKQLQRFAPVREVLDSTSSRRFYQLVAYFEKELGASWPHLLDRLAGRGAVLGVKLGPKPAPALLIVEGHDKKLMRRFFELGLNVLEQELARQEAKDRPVKGSYEGIDTVTIGAEFHAAAAGSTLFISNHEKALHAGLDRYLGRGDRSVLKGTSATEAARLLPPEPLVSFWLNMETIRKAPGAKAAYQPPPRDDPNLTVLLGHYLDLLGRTPFVCAGVYPEKHGFLATIRTPRGSDGMGADRLMHVPPAGMPGSRPLLEPKNVLYSESNFLDISAIWKDRAKLFNEKQAQALEKFDKQSAPFLAGGKVSKLLTQVGPYYRFVAAHPARPGYQASPKISIPAFALVWELREPEAFGKSMETILRGAALLAGAQASLKLAEESYKDCKLVGYRFPEDKPLKGDVNDLRFNFSPCFTRVGDQFIWCSTIELCRELVDLIQKEDRSPSRGAPMSARSRIYGSGGAAYLQTLEDLFVTGTALDQAVTPKEAREQIKTFLDLLRRFGALSFEAQFQDTTAQYNIRLQAEK